MGVGLKKRRRKLGPLKVSALSSGVLHFPYACTIYGSRFAAGLDAHIIIDALCDLTTATGVVNFIEHFRSATASTAPSSMARALVLMTPPFGMVNTHCY